MKCTWLTILLSVVLLLTSSSGADVVFDRHGNCFHNDLTFVFYVMIVQVLPLISIINFTIFCNGCIFFHESANATSLIQNFDYIYGIISKVVADIGIKHVV